MLLLLFADEHLVFLKCISIPKMYVIINLTSLQLYISVTGCYIKTKISDSSHTTARYYFTYLIILIFQLTRVNWVTFCYRPSSFVVTLPIREREYTHWIWLNILIDLVFYAFCLYFFIKYFKLNRLNIYKKHLIFVFPVYRK